MKNQYPLVTVITPTYNRAEYLEETIKSVLSQDYPNIEYIILDDGSTDNSAEIIKKYLKKVIWETHKNIGEVPTVNKGLAMAKGEIITVVNSDDPLLPGAIKSAVTFMQKNPKIIVVYGDWVNIDENGHTIEEFKTLDYSYEYMIRTHNCLIGPGAFFRKIVVERLKGRDTKFKYVSDFDFWLRAGLIGAFARIPRILSTSRIHSGQATFEHRSFSMAIDHILILNKIFGLPNIPPHIKKLKPQAYESACEAARICRGNNIFSKIAISFVSFYYAPRSYLQLFISYRLKKLQKMLG
jgi:glycosyltransferase involved in cell wall biosynthesis